MNSAQTDPATVVIPAYSKAQVMDWSLVLASQDIPATIIQSSDRTWGLEIEPQDHERALAAIRLYRVENRRWLWRQPVPWSDATFHWGALGWCLLLILIHWATWADAPSFRDAAMFNTAKAAHGEWWRAFSAILLHADLRHLMANTSIGLVLFGLAMARYGAGTGLLAAYLCGAAGNLAGLLLAIKPYIGLGASGMVMAALGLVSVPHGARWTSHPRALKQLFQAVLAGILLFIILGTNPASDVIAHAGGFVAGVLLGLGLNLLPPSAFQRKWLTVPSWLLLVTLVLGPMWLAAHAPPIKPTAQQTIPPDAPALNPGAGRNRS